MMTNCSATDHAEGRVKLVKRHVSIHFTAADLAEILKYALDKKLLALSFVLTDLEK